jgi:hypothetical protein
MKISRPAGAGINQTTDKLMPHAYMALAHCSTLPASLSEPKVGASSLLEACVNKVVCHTKRRNMFLPCREATMNCSFSVPGKHQNGSHLVHGCMTA